MPNTLQIRDVLPLRYIGLLPLAAKVIKTDVHINATTGYWRRSQPSETTHFSWRSNHVITKHSTTSI
jgi:hypothetical protein